MKLKYRLLALTVACCCVLSLPVHASALEDEEIAAPSAVLMEASTGKMLYAKNEHEQRPCASITKVMTLLLVMEALDSGEIALTDMLTTSAHASSMGGSDIWLKEGETMSVDDLLKATVIMSANDAAVVLAEYLAGTEDEFVQRMNERAQELGMNDTVFKNCNGLDEDGHVTSAYDVALMSAELIKHEKIFDYTQVWMDYIRNGETQLVNTNKLLKSYNGITGLKTGTTGAAGSCITATAERDGLSLISVVLGCSSTTDRFSSAATLLDYGFANWAMIEAQPPELSVVPVSKGMQSEVIPVFEKSEMILVEKGNKAEVTYDVAMAENLEAPVEQGQVIGTVTYKQGDQELQKVSIYAKDAVEKISFSAVFALLLQQLVAA